MGKGNIKDKVTTRTGSGPQGDNPPDQVELLGKSFRIVPNGLDPDEVVDFFKSTAGSSESALKRLEQFSTFKTMTTVMEESIAEARGLVEEAKTQARAEAERETARIVEEAKARVEREKARAVEEAKMRAKAEADEQKARTLEEAKGQAVAALEKAKKTSIASVDGICAVLLDTVNDAVEKAKDTAAIILAGVDDSIQEIKQRRIQDSSEGKASRQQPPDSENAPAAKPKSEVGQAAPEPKQTRDSAALQENVNRILESGPSGSEVEPAKVGGLAGGSESERTGRKVPVGGQPNDDAQAAHSGDVTLLIPEGAADAWMEEFRQKMSEVPGAHIHAESGMGERTTAVKLSLDEPVALVTMLQQLPNVGAVTRLRNGEGLAQGRKLRWLHGNDASQAAFSIEFEDNGQDRRASVAAADELASGS